MCSVLANDVFDELYRENRSLVANLVHEQQLRQLADQIINHLLGLTVNCNCPHDDDLMDKLKTMTVEYQRQKASNDSSIDHPFYEPVLRETVVPTIDMADCSYQCQECQQLFTTDIDLEIHINSVHKSCQSFVCHECHHICETQDLFVEHLEQSHGFKANNINEDEEEEEEKLVQNDIKPDVRRSDVSMSPSWSPYTSPVKSSPYKLSPVLTKLSPRSLVKSMRVFGGGDDEVNPDFRLMSEMLHQSYANNLNEKLETTKNKKIYKCNKCSQQFNRQPFLEAHVNRVHNKTKPFLCDKCDQRFYAKHYLDKHLAAEHKIKSFECNLCSFKTMSSNNILLHKKRMHSGTNGPNAKSVKTTTKTVNVKNIGQKKSDEFVCDLCDFKTTAKYSFILHKSSHSMTKKKLRCNVNGCGKVFASEASVRQHEKLVHKNLMTTQAKKPKVFRCHISDCKEIFINKVRLDSHRLQTHGISLPKPSETIKTVAKKSQTKRSSGGDGDDSTISAKNTTHRCDVSGCRKRFKTMSFLVVHQRQAHSIVKRFGCDYADCRRYFKTNAKLQAHIRQHKELEKRFTCHWNGCNFKTDTYAKLNQHKRQLKHTSSGL